MKKEIRTIAIGVAIVGIVLMGLVSFFWHNDRINDTKHNDSEGIPTYNVSEEVNQVLAHKKENKAEIVGQIITNDPKIALCFEGLPSRNLAERILSLLEVRKVHAVFFMSGQEVAQDPELVMKLKEGGHQVASYGFSGQSHMEKLTLEEIASDFLMSKKIFEEKTNESVEYIKLNATQINDTILEIAKGCGFSQLVSSSNYLDASSFASLDMAKGYVHSLQPGSIVSIKVSDLLDETEYEKKEEVTTGMKDPTISENTTQILSQDDKLLQTIDYFLQAVNETFKVVLLDELATKEEQKLTDQVKENLVLNKGNIPENLTYIKTTQKAVCYTFFGIHEEEAVQNVRQALKDNKAFGTFFVTYEDMQKRKKVIQKLREDGHEIGLALNSKKDMTVWKYASEIALAREYYRKYYNDEIAFVLQPYGAVDDTLKEAVLAMKLTWVTYTTAVVHGERTEDRTAKEIMAELFDSSVDSFRRGDIIYYRLDYYENKQLIADLVREITKNRVDNIAYTMDRNNDEANGSEYHIVSLKMMSSSKECYEFPELEPQTVIAKGYLKGKSEAETFEELKNFYVGNPYISDKDNLPGFSLQEIRQLDRSGKVSQKNSDKKLLFLTFDDWGSDASVNKLLYVLNKYDVEATFFVLTGNVSNNYNLLRSIAAEGHAIGVHTHNHLKLAEYVESSKSYKSISKKKAKLLEQDAIEAYDLLYHAIGDMVVMQKPALTTLFRPPTLAVSKIGLESILDAGYSYSVSGSFSTHDYEAKNARQLANSLIRQSRDGAVFIMHMSDDACYTAEALDLVIPELLASGYEFGRLDDYME